MWLLSQPSKTPTPPSVLQGKSEGEMRNRSYVLYTATKKNHTMRLPIMSYGTGWACPSEPAGAQMSKPQTATRN